MTVLSERIRAEAAHSDRPGQMDRLNQIADEVDALVASLADHENRENCSGCGHGRHHSRCSLSPSCGCGRF